MTMVFPCSMGYGFPTLFYLVLPQRNALPEIPSKPLAQLHYTDTGPTLIAERQQLPLLQPLVNPGLNLVSSSPKAEALPTELLISMEILHTIIMKIKLKLIYFCDLRSELPKIVTIIS